MKRGLRYYTAFAIFTIAIFLLIGLTIVFQEIVKDVVWVQGLTLLLTGCLLANLVMLLFQKRWNLQVWYLFFVYLLMMFFVADKLFAELFGLIIDFGFLLLIPITMLVLSIEYVPRFYPAPVTDSQMSLAWESSQDAPTTTIDMPEPPKPKEEDGFLPVEKVKDDEYLPVEQVVKSEVIPAKEEEKPTFISNVQINNIPAPVQESLKEHDVKDIVEDEVADAAEEFDRYLEGKFSEIKGDIDSVKKEEIFIASTNGKKFHNPTCMIATRIPEEKRILFKDPKEAIEKGLSPCGVCVPISSGI